MRSWASKAGRLVCHPPLEGKRRVHTAVNHEVSAALSQLYRELDVQIAKFQATTGLHCPPGCGQCCENPEVEATPLEMVPMALEMIRRGEAASWIDLITVAEAPGKCIFYQADNLIPGNGRCQMYLWRPTLCRLFGFAAVTDKSGQPKLAACVKHKQVFPENVAMADVAIANGFPIPRFRDWQTRIANIDAHWGYQRMPINVALKVAIERLSLSLSYELENSSNAVGTGENSALATSEEQSTQG